MESAMPSPSTTPESAPQSVHFKTKTNIAFPGITPDTRRKMHGLIRELGITEGQIVEAASYSMAMVVRYALGLSATGGRVCAFVGNSLAGRVALATLRHLVNAGAEGIVLTVSESGDVIHDELKVLQKMGVPLEMCRDAGGGSSTQKIIESSHNVICGLFEGISDTTFASAIVTLLNELSTPVHTVEAPLGVDPFTGTRDNPLFASSTLSLGAPLIGLSAGAECVGRHYLCDISATTAIYKESGSADLTSLFAEQPVLQISEFTLPEGVVS